MTTKDERRLFVVSFEAEAVVLAHDEEEAREIASSWENRGDILEGASDESGWDARPMTHIPAGWEEPGTLVFHAGDEDIELASLLDQSARAK